MRSIRAREKRQRLILSSTSCLKNTAMLTRKRMGMRMVALILSKSCSASRLIRLWGLSHGMVVLTPLMAQFPGTLLADWLASSTVHEDVVLTSVETRFGGVTDGKSHLVRRRFATHTDKQLQENCCTSCLLAQAIVLSFNSLC